jgi:hypothetical protein
LAYGPLADRTIRSSASSAPIELARQLEAAAGQSAAAVDALRAAGLTPADVDALADAMADQLGSDNPDQVQAEQRVVDLLRDRLTEDGLVALAASFDRDHPTVAAVFDLGDVSDVVATSSGYGCLLDG